MRLLRTIATGSLIAVAAFATMRLVPQASPDLCFAAGPVTYRLSVSAPAPDYRVAIDNAAARPDMRVQLVDRIDTADFALTDDAGMLTGQACRTGASIRTVRIVPAGDAADLTIALTPARAGRADFSLYVHSARVSHAGAAALFALVRHAPDADRELDGEQVADAR